MRKTILKYAGILALIIGLGLTGFTVNSYADKSNNKNYRDNGRHYGWHHRDYRDNGRHYGRHHNDRDGYGPCWDDDDDDDDDNDEKK